MTFTTQPIEFWPGQLRTDAQRIRSPFSSSYTSTMTLLDRELEFLRAQVVVLQLAVNRGQIRRDGSGVLARATPDHPGVILSFKTRAGQFRYACDRFTHWQDNLRAIALGLEALRKIERYGIGAGTEQYTGFLQLETAAPKSVMTYDEALSFVADAVGASRAKVRERWRYADSRGEMYRAAARALHPDTGGDPDRFQYLQVAKRLLDAGEE